MVGPLSLAGMGVTLLVCFALPATGALYLHRREGIAAQSLLIGALVFFLTQMLLCRPLLPDLFGQP